MADVLLHLQVDAQLAVAESDVKNQVAAESDELSQAKSDDQYRLHHQRDLAQSAVLAVLTVLTVSTVLTGQPAQYSRLVLVAELLAVA